MAWIMSARSSTSALRRTTSSPPGRRPGRPPRPGTSAAGRASGRAGGVRGAGGGHDRPDGTDATSPTADATGLVDGAELYGPVCFQSGRFRRIAMLPEASSRSCRALARGADERPWFVAPGQLTLERLAPGPLTRDRLPPREALAGPAATPGWTRSGAAAGQAGSGGIGGGEQGGGLLLGSPGVNDVVLQVLQACVPHRRVWLASCASVSFSGRLADGPVEVRAMARPPATRTRRRRTRRSTRRQRTRRYRASACPRRPGARTGRRRRCRPGCRCRPG